MQVSEIIYLLGDRNSVSFSPKSCPCKLPVPLNDTNCSQSPRCQLFALLWGSSFISVLGASTMLLPPSKYLSPQPPSLACTVPTVFWFDRLAPTQGLLWDLPGQPPLDSFFPASLLHLPIVLPQSLRCLSTLVTSKRTDDLVLQSFVYLCESLPSLHCLPRVRAMSSSFFNHLLLVQTQNKALEQNCLGSSSDAIIHSSCDLQQLTLSLSLIALIYKMGIITVHTSLDCHAH